MQIFLVRHGDADAEIPEGLGDAGRALTAKARHAVAAHFAALVPRMGGVGLILTSPLVRTVQTAQLLSNALRFEGILKAHRGLLPEMPVGTLDTVVHEHRGESLVLVGHQPTIGAMAAHLLGLSHFPKPVNPGTVIGLSLEDTKDAGPARLLFYAAPRHDLLETVE